MKFKSYISKISSFEKSTRERGGRKGGGRERERERERFDLVIMAAALLMNFS